MMKELFPGLDENELLELWPTYKVDEKKVEKLTTTNISHANIALNSILDDLEKAQLEKLFFADNGWYKIINQDGMVQLKLAAMSLGLSNNVFTFDSTEEQHMLEVVGALSREQQVLNMRCYMKQKVVTYSTLKKYLTKIRKQEDMSITLYRGVRHDGEVKKYVFSEIGRAHV